MRLRSLCLLLAAAGLFASCAPEPSPASPTMESAEVAPTAMAAAPATVDVSVDGRVPDFVASYLDYFPEEVTIHPGDTVNFNLVDTGEPHTVTFGKLADDAVQQFDALGPMAGEDTPEAKALPLMSPNDDPLNLTQSTAQPCYLATGSPGTDACSAADQQQTAFDGSQSYYNSGWMAPDSTFAVTFDENTPPGTYHYICLLHRGQMTGTVTVVAADQPAQTPAEVAQAGDDELQAMADQLKTDLLSFPEPVTGTVQAGMLFEDVQNGMVNVFQPTDLTINAGDSVSWPILGPHTISFNAPEGASTLRLEKADGSVVVNPDAADAQGWAGMPPPPDQAPDQAPPDPNAPPPPPVQVDAGVWDGQGFHSSGFLPSFPPGPLFEYKLTFSEPGTYAYHCLVHPDMKGTITVN